MQNNVMNFIKDFEATNKIKPEYDLSGDNISTIINESIHSGDVSELIGLVRNFFVFGYAQGYEAKTAEMKEPSRHLNNAQL